MSPRQEEEFELVLGNKQLLSLFFLVVVLFGVFFSFGYTVGYGRGESSSTREVGSAEPVDTPAKKVELPETLLQEAPKPTETSSAAKAEPPPSPPPQTTTPAKSESPAAVTQTEPAKEAPKPSPVTKETAKSTPPPVNASPPPKPAAPPPKASTPASKPAAQSASGGAQLQISAVRVKKDAEVFVDQLKSKGHPALLSDQGDGWYRVMVGPFDSTSEAEAYQKRLREEGYQSLIRKR